MFLKRFWLLGFATALLIAMGNASVSAQGVIPSPGSILYDAKHKEPKSGVEIHGNQIVIRSGVGTPTTVNVLSFSRDGKLLAAGKDFGRVVVWDVTRRSFLCAIETSQGIVNAVAISPDDQVLATDGTNGDPGIKLWRLPDGKLLKNLGAGSSAVQKLVFGPDASSLIVAENNAVTYVLDTGSGERKLDLSGEWAPTLSLDGKALMTVSKADLILRSTNDWQKQGALPKLTKYVIPLALDTQLDTYIYGDATDENSFVAVCLGTGEMLPNPRTVKLPKFNPSTGYFASLDPSSGLVFGHSEGRLWVWDIRTGKTCTSQILYSEGGALSADGSILVGAIDNSIMAQDKVKPGIGVWETSAVRKSCGM